MRVHYLQHVPFEGLGSIETSLTAAGCQISCTRLYEDATFPDCSEFDLLVVMGGPMSVNDEHEYPWLVPEKQFVRAAVSEGKRLLGICLGAQLIASSLGAPVYASTHKEIGWYPISGTTPSDNSAFRFPRELEVFHWHGETFDLPEDSVLLASSEGCKNQAFQIGTNIIGLQFHLETTPESARDLVAHCGDELVPARYVQTQSEILQAPTARYLAINRLMADLLEYLRSAD